MPKAKQAPIIPRSQLKQEIQLKQFLKVVFASMMGTLLAFCFFVFLILAMATASLISDSDQWDTELASIKDQSVLTLNLDGPLNDHTSRRDLFSSIMKYDDPPVSGLFEISQVLKAAAGDSRIKGLLINFENFQSGMANAEALRREIMEFKKSGKFVISYGEYYSELAYLVASASDEVVLYPKGFFEWDGLFSKMGYFKNTLSKLNVTPQVFRAGKYKSAIEPFITDKMSEESREQINEIIDLAWQQMLFYAAEKTKLSFEELNKLAENAEIIYAKKAHEKGFVNTLASFEEVETKLMELTESKEKPNYISWRSYKNQEADEKFSVSKDKVAVVFAAGEIHSGAGDGDSISSKTFSEILNKIRRDEKIKAVVIRVNSPGGSALASDVIWTSTQWLKDAKPVVTSFGNVAASGGYYMSAGSQYIFAEPTTITGSIGVFGLTFATEKFFNEKIGMTFDTAKSHNFADLESLEREFTPQEFQIMQNMVDQIYEDFLAVVTQGREKLNTREKAHELAQGRVWMGSRALELGLVDEIGGIHQAITKASQLAELKDYSVEVYPKELTAFEEFVRQFGDISFKTVQMFLPEPLIKAYLSRDQKISEKILTRLPVSIEIQ